MLVLSAGSPSSVFIVVYHNIPSCFQKEQISLKLFFCPAFMSPHTQNVLFPAPKRHDKVKQGSLVILRKCLWYREGREGREKRRMVRFSHMFKFFALEMEFLKADQLFLLCFYFIVFHFYHFLPKKNKINSFVTSLTFCVE